MTTEIDLCAMTHDVLRLVVNPAVRSICPGCDGATHLRADTGLCERCTAKQPVSIEAWRQWREMCHVKVVRRSEPMDEHTCLECFEWYGPRTKTLHKERCSSKVHVCSCAQRFGTRAELNAHRKARRHA